MGIVFHNNGDCFGRNGDSAPAAVDIHTTQFLVFVAPTGGLSDGGRTRSLSGSGVTVFHHSVRGDVRRIRFG